MNKTTKSAPKSYRSPLGGSGTNFGKQINPYQYCKHGCLYCYARIRPMQSVIPYSTWINPIPRLDTPALLRKQLKGMRAETKNKIKDIFICSATDPYQPLDNNFELTRDVIKLLVEYEMPFTVLTKNANVVRDIDLFKGYDKCRVGLTIITLNDDFRKQLEPHTSPIDERIEALKQLKEAGISTYCSVEPIMSRPDGDPIPIVKRLHKWVDLFEFGVWNPKFKAKIPGIGCQ